MPKLLTKKEEDEFLGTKSDPTKKSSPLKTISLKLTEKQINEAKEIAYANGVPYQSLIRLWIAERIKKEKENEDK